MIDEFDFNSVSQKIMTDNFQMKVIGGILYLALQSGTSTPCYLFPLGAAKAMGRGLIKQVEEIEQKTGQKFDMPLSDEAVVSPLNIKPEDPKK